MDTSIDSGSSLPLGELFITNFVNLFVSIIYITNINNNTCYLILKKVLRALYCLCPFKDLIVLFITRSGVICRASKIYLQEVYDM